MNASANLDSFQKPEVAKAIRSYVRSSGGNDELEMEKALQRICPWLAFLLEDLLDGTLGWSGWVDGVSPATDMIPDPVKVISNVELSVRGRADWGESAGTGPFWIEPFLGSVRISETA